MSILYLEETNDGEGVKSGRRALTGTQIGNKRYQDVSVGSSAGTVDSDNSSSTPLADAAEFTGTGVDVSSYATITVFVDTDLDGVLKMQFSADNVNWDRQKVVYVDQEIESGSVHTLEVVSQYFRVVYCNSTGNGTQGHFRLQTIFHQFRSGFLANSPDQIINKSNDAQIVRVSNDPFLDISRGLYAYKFAFHRFGFNPAVPNGSEADIWAYGPNDSLYNWPSTDETFRVAAGGDTNDTAAGSGARTIQIVYLDANGNQQQEQLTLAGSSASGATSVTGRRLIRAWVDTCGTILSNNTGEIIIENSTSGQVVGYIGAGVGQTELSMYTVPLGYTAYLTRVQVSVSIGTNKDANVKMWQRQDAYTTTAPFGVKRLIRQWTAIQGADNLIEYQSTPKFPALTDIWATGQGNGSTTEIDVDYDLILVKDESPTVPL